MKWIRLCYKNIIKYKSYGRIVYIIGFFLTFAGIIIWKMFSYTVFHYPFYQNLADTQQIGEVTVPVTRGTIYSAPPNSTIIATSLNLYDIAIDPKNIGNKRKLLGFLEDIVYKELCETKKRKQCYNNLLKYLRLIETENSQYDIPKLREMLGERLKSKIYQEKVTSVFIDMELTDEMIGEITSFKLPGIYINNSYLYANPEEIFDLEGVSQKIANITGLESDYLKNNMRKRDLRYVSIINKVGISVGEEIKNYLADERIALKNGMLERDDSIGSFIIFTPKPHRYYPEKDIGSQIIGFVDSTGRGHYGIEGYFHDILQGNNGKIVSRKDIKGRIIDPISLDKKDLIGEGIKIYTTIDRNIQSRIEDILESGVKKYQANKGSIVVMNPTNGNIISMAQYPKYDLNEYGDVYELEKVRYSRYPEPLIDLLGYPVFVEDKKEGKKYYYNSKEIFLRPATEIELGDIKVIKYKYKNGFGPLIYKNDSISGLYEPGSIMKSVTVAIGIDTDEIGRYHMYLDKGEVEIDNFRIKNDSDKCLGYHSFAHALNYSCNVGMIRIVQRVGKVLMNQYFKDFGFGNETDIPLNGEVYAQIKPWERWSIAQLLTSSYGLGISVTPLQMAGAYSILANGGLYIKPNIIDRIIFPDGREIHYSPETERRVIKKTTSDIVTSMLYSSIENGVAKNAKVYGYSMAGKTGTSQIPKKGKYETGVGSTIASFAGYGPVQDPRFVIIIKLERPRLYGGYGGRTSAVLFKEISEYLLDYYGIPKKESN